MERRLSRSASGGSDLAVLLHSFDGYRRYWLPAAHFTAKHLPANQEIHFATEERTLDDERLIPLLTGTGTFVARLTRAAKQLEQRGVRSILYLQEDMWLTEPITTVQLDNWVDLMDRHRLDSLKLGKESVWGPEIPSIREAPRLDDERPGRAFSWFGEHHWAMSHHITIFRPRFLIQSLYAATLRRKREPIQHEIFCSLYLKTRVAAGPNDEKPYRIAVWNDQPAVRYVHASANGKLTQPGLDLLKQEGIDDLYRPGLEGEVIPGRD